MNGAMKPEIVLIYARAANGAIGNDGDLPWRLPADLKRFNQLIMIQTVRNKAMPLGNQTNMTDDERAQLGRWLSDH